jgi:hypothetical protein
MGDPPSPSTLERICSMRELFYGVFALAVLFGAVRLALAEDAPRPPHAGDRALVGR